MSITMHLCRGQLSLQLDRSGRLRTGGRAPVNQIGVNGYFMEFDTERAGGFEPLRLVPKGKTVVLGLVTSKTGALESVAELERRVAGAAKYLDLEQLCLSPRCGFASTEEGNVLTEAEQRAKLAHRRGRTGFAGGVNAAIVRLQVRELLVSPCATCG
jgi:5-methyltetrahydropteroyltriglutamate--homocysteine methyltransferase